jgi:SAM-dependent methyltransferase
MFEVLQNRKDIDLARQSLRGRGLTVVRNGLFSRLSRRLGLARGLPVGDHVKSWDVNRTVNFAEERLSRDARILDLGAYCSEIPVALAHMGYTGVHGVDLNPDVKSMPCADRVKYTISDFMNTPFESGSFDAVTAISVIEHGYSPEKLFAEVSRLLKPNGYFIASFDYWPEKIDTGNTRFFDMSWLIFSAQDVDQMMDVARQHGFAPAGAIHAGASERAIHCMGFDYTFGWVVFEKIA